VGILSGLRVVEGSAFVAAPLGGTTLAQLGADVIRFDGLGGGIDARRWPVTASGHSLYWDGLNAGKRSLRIDIRRPEGREIVTALVGAPGDDGGILLTNFPATGWLGREAMAARRADVIVVNIQGNPDGSSEVDYTVNAAVGFPLLTGPVGHDGPVNNVLPAWDVATGLYAALGVVAAERHRRVTGEGQLVTVALSDVALAVLGRLGYLAEAELGGVRERTGNDLYGAFGRDLPTADGRRVMVVAISARQWQGLVAACGMAEAVARIEASRGLDLGDEGDRWEARDAIADIVGAWCAARPFVEVAAAFSRHDVCWGPYRSVAELVAHDPRCSTANPMFARVDQPGVGELLVPGVPLAFGAVPREAVRPAPRLGQHTDEVLAEVLALSELEIGRLHDDGIVAGPDTDAVGAGAGGAGARA
jgi:2-methylfumaryl-CoA isomerase